MRFRAMIARGSGLMLCLTCNSVVRAQGECNPTGCAISESQFPSGTFSTTSNTFVSVATNIFAGEWARYSVTSGSTYEWSLCAADGGSASYDSQLTLRTDANPGTPICYSDDYCTGFDAKIRWTATFTGTVRVQVNVFNCGTNSTLTALVWRCASCGPSTGSLVATLRNRDCGATAPANGTCFIL